MNVRTTSEVKRRRVTFVHAILALCICAQTTCRINDSAPTVIFVVRHAEKAVTEGNDPSLSDAGRARAGALARVVEDTQINAIYCTQFRRTRETAEPVIERTREAAVNTIDVNMDDTQAYVERLAADVFAKHRGQSVLIVSHSNTVPSIVERFSGKPVAKIRDDAYGDLFIITIGANRETKIIKAQYQAPL